MTSNEKNNKNEDNTAQCRKRLNFPESPAIPFKPTQLQTKSLEGPPLNPKPQSLLIPKRLNPKP